MQVIILFGLVYLAQGGLIDHQSEHGHATSYQNIHMEHYHAVPTYIKKEDMHFLEHPISIGKSSSKVEIHHGGKDDHGYAFASVENDLHNTFEYSPEGHDYIGQAEQTYQVHDQGAELGHYQQEEEQGLGQYQTQEEYGYQHQER